MFIIRIILYIAKWGLLEWITYLLGAVGLFTGGMGLYQNPKFGWISFPMIVIGILLILFALVLFSLSYFKCIRVFPLHGEGKNFFIENIKRACTCDSKIFSTFLLERAKDDLVTYLLNSERLNSTKTATVLYERFIMIDDPTQEKRWITDFLKTQNLNTNQNLLKIKTIVYAVESPGRPIVRLVQALIPRISITLIKTSIDKESLVYISLSEAIDFDGTTQDSKFGVAIYSNDLYNILENFIKNNFLRHPDKIRTFNNLDDYDQKTTPTLAHPLTIRLLNEIEEIALMNINIKHIGVFGSYAKLGEYRTKVNDSSYKKRWKAESDLDLLIVIEENSDKNEVKELIEKRLLTQVDDKLKNVFEIEWSNEKPNFYYFRKKYHMDIQLHFVNDEYYSKETPLLGYSIFSQSYFELYSKNSLPIYRFILVPQNPLSIAERTDIFLNDPLGLNKFITECSVNNPYIDPRRVLAINICNLVWTITGMRTQSYIQAFEYINSKLNNDILQNKKDQINILLYIIMQDIQPNTDIQKKYLLETSKILNTFKTIVEPMKKE